MAGGQKGKDDRKPDTVSSLIYSCIPARTRFELGSAGGGEGTGLGGKGPLLERLDDLGLSCLVYDGEGLVGGLEGTVSAMVVL